MAQVQLGLTAVFVLAMLGSSELKAQYSKTQDDVAAEKRLSGMWRLVSYVERLADGTTRPNPKSVGYITYTETNRMCYVGMNPDRQKMAISQRSYAGRDDSQPWRQGL